MKTGIELIAQERTRQVEQEKWTNLHDSEDHQNMEMTGAACCYAASAINKHFKENKVRFQILEAADELPPVEDNRGRNQPGWVDGWPWGPEWDKRVKHDQIRSLVIAGALIAAEIDRLTGKPENA